jgi:hypothetical protein
MVRNDERILIGVLDTISRTTIASENAPKGPPLAMCLYYEAISLGI